MTGRVAVTRRREDEQHASPVLAGDIAAMPEPHDGVIDTAQLVRRAAAGDHRAWEGLVDQYSKLIWAMTRDFRLVESDAADVVQATWLRLLENIGRIEYPDRVGSWLATTARHECLRHVTARKRVMLVQDDDISLTEPVSHQPEVDERLLADERARDVREALALLPGLPAAAAWNGSACSCRPAEPPSETRVIRTRQIPAAPRGLFRQVACRPNAAFFWTNLPGCIRIGSLRFLLNAGVVTVPPGAA
jgi:RNA polymerase sigma factor (sigma-70 family)